MNFVEANQRSEGHRLTVREGGSALGRKVAVHVCLDLFLQGVLVLRAGLWAFLFSSSELGTWLTALLLVEFLSFRRSRVFHDALVQGGSNRFARSFPLALTSCLCLDAISACALLALGLLFKSFMGIRALTLLALAVPLVFAQTATLPEAWWHCRGNFVVDKKARGYGLVAELIVLFLARPALGLAALPLSLLTSWWIRGGVLWGRTPLSFRPGFADRGLRRELFRFTLPLLLDKPLAFLGGRAVEVMVRVFRSSAEFGVFAMAMTPFAPLRQLAARASLPLLSAWAIVGNDSKALITAHGRALRRYQRLSLPVLAFLALFGPPLISLCFDESWSLAARLLPVLAMGHTLRAYAGTVWWTTVLKARGKNAVIPLVTVLGVLTAVLAAWQLLPRAGVSAAPWVWVIQMTLVGPVLTHLAYRQALGAWLVPGMDPSAPSSLAFATLPFLLLPWPLETPLALAGALVSWLALLTMALWLWDRSGHENLLSDLRQVLSPSFHRRAA